MTRALIFRVVVLAAVLTGCSAPVSPSSSDAVPVGSTRLSLEARAPASLPPWITEPATLPAGRVGQNNCTFLLPVGYQWDAHPEGSCWEHVAADGWTRQQFQKIHIPSFPSCGGGPGDATAIRVCRAGGGGQPSPCQIDRFTGPNGCARCVISPTCH